MEGVRVAIKISGAEAVERRFLALAERAADLQPAWDVLAERFKDLEDRRFMSGAGWAPLKPGYARWKAQHYGGRPVLTLTGRLHQSLSEHLDIDIRSPHSMTLGTAVPYARYHQHGTSKMVPRPPIQMSEAEVRSWTNYLRDWLLGRERGSA